MNLQNSEVDWNFDAPQYCDFGKVMVGLDENSCTESYFAYDHEQPFEFVPAVTSLNESEAEIDDYDESTIEEAQAAKVYYKPSCNDQDNKLQLNESQILKLQINEESNTLAKQNVSLIFNQDQIGFPIHVVNTDISNIEGKTVIPDVSLNSYKPNDILENSKKLKELIIVQHNKPMDLLANLPEFNKEVVKPVTLVNSSKENLNQLNKCEGGRVVLKVNSARKRLSMSVDRGHDRLKTFRSNFRVPMITDDMHHLPSSNSRKHLRFEMDKENHKPINEETLEQNIVHSLIKGNEDEVNEERMNATQIVPHPGIQFKLKKDILTTFKPFSFEDRNKQLKEKKEKFVQKVLEEEKNQRKTFKAQPFPELIFIQAPSNQLHISNQSIAMPGQTSQPRKRGRISAPSSLAGSQTNLRTSNVKINMHESDEGKMVSFKARKATILTKAPFIPIKPLRPNIDVLPTMFKLKTQERAEHRINVECAKKLKEEEEMKIKKELDLIKQMEDEKMMKEERAATVHRAQPVRHYKPVEPLNARTTPVRSTSTKSLHRAHSLVGTKNKM